MKIDYEPHRLHKTVKDIQRKHPMTNEISEENHLADSEKFIRDICSLSEKQLNIEKLYLPYRPYIQIAVYLASGNYYQVDHSNLRELLNYKLDERIFEILFHGWKHLYGNAEFQKIFLQLIKRHIELVNRTLKNRYLVPMESYLVRWVASGDPAYQVGCDCLKIVTSGRCTFDEKLQGVHIESTSVLGQECKKKFYTFCARADYLQVDDLQLCKLVQTLDEKSQKAFLSNFLLALQRDDFKAYFNLGKAFLRKTGEDGTEKYKQYFSGFQNIQTEKYRIWLNLTKIRESFSNDEKDERIIFWDKYVEYGEFIINKYSQSVTIAFPRYCVVEFMQKTMGPIYIYKKDYYKASIGPLVVTKSNQQLRQLLYGEKPYMKRITHQGNWQGEVRSIISNYEMLYD